MKDLDEVKPRSNEGKWQDNILKPEFKKKGEWQTFRVIGGVFSCAQHWVQYVKADGDKKNFPVDCLAWDPDREEVSNARRHECPGCLAGIKPSIKYFFNVIDRKLQSKGMSDYIRALEMPPTAMSKITGLKSLNRVNNEPKSIAHKEYGCDLYITQVEKKGGMGVDWEIQKGERTPLTPDELRAELYDFEALYAPRDASDARKSLERAGYLKSNEEPVANKAGYTPMPTSGTQLPPSTFGNAPNFSKEILKQSSSLPVTNNLIQSNSPVVTPGSLGKLPEKMVSSDKPSCFGDFQGNLDCPTCPHKPACLVLTQEREI
jgi:hypothetical protein